MSQKTSSAPENRSLPDIKKEFSRQLENTPNSEVLLILLLEMERIVRDTIGPKSAPLRFLNTTKKKEQSKLQALAKKEKEIYSAIWQRYSEKVDKLLNESLRIDGGVDYFLEQIRERIESVVSLDAAAALTELGILENKTIEREILTPEDRESPPSPEDREVKEKKESVPRVQILIGLLHENGIFAEDISRVDGKKNNNRRRGFPYVCLWIPSISRTIFISNEYGEGAYVRAGFDLSDIEKSEGKIYQGLNNAKMIAFRDKDQWKEDMREALFGEELQTNKTSKKSKAPQAREKETKANLNIMILVHEGILQISAEDYDSLPESLKQKDKEGKVFAFDKLENFQHPLCGGYENFKKLQNIKGGKQERGKIRINGESLTVLASAVIKPALQAEYSHVKKGQRWLPGNTESHLALLMIALFPDEAKNDPRVQYHLLREDQKAEFWKNYIETPQDNISEEDYNSLPESLKPKNQKGEAVSFDDLEDFGHPLCGGYENFKKLQTIRNTERQKVRINGESLRTLAEKVITSELQATYGHTEKKKRWAPGSISSHLALLMVALFPEEGKNDQWVTRRLAKKEQT